MGHFRKLPSIKFVISVINCFNELFITDGKIWMYVVPLARIDIESAGSISNGLIPKMFELITYNFDHWPFFPGFKVLGHKWLGSVG